MHIQEETRLSDQMHARLGNGCHIERRIPWRLGLLLQAVSTNLFLERREAGCARQAMTATKSLDHDKSNLDILRMRRLGRLFCFPRFARSTRPVHDTSPCLARAKNRRPRLSFSAICCAFCAFGQVTPNSFAFFPCLDDVIIVKSIHKLSSPESLSLVFVSHLRSPPT